MNQEYLQSIYNYFNEKHSNKKCKSCKNDKIFTESNNKIIFSCGENDSKICGIQLDIDIPNYVNINDVNMMKKLINEKINYTVLSNYIDIPIEDNSDEIEYINKIKKIYDKNNNIIDKNELYNDIIRKRKRLYSDLDTSDPKSYIKNMKEINILYREILDIINNISDILIVDKPIINKNNTNKSKKTSALKLKVKWTKNKKTMYGIVEHIIKNKFVVNSNNTQYVLKKDNLEIISDIEYEEMTRDDIINIGDRVSWLNKSNFKISGNVIDINKNNAIIEDDNKDNYVIPIDSLNK